MALGSAEHQYIYIWYIYNMYNVSLYILAIPLQTTRNAQNIKLHEIILIETK